LAETGYASYSNKQPGEVRLKVTRLIRDCTYYTPFRVEKDMINVTIKWVTFGTSWIRIIDYNVAGKECMR